MYYQAPPCVSVVARVPLVEKCYFAVFLKFGRKKGVIFFEMARLHYDSASNIFIKEREAKSKFSLVGCTSSCLCYSLLGLQRKTRQKMGGRKKKGENGNIF